MYTAYKYARRKYRDHQQKREQTIELHSQAGSSSRPNSASTPLTLALTTRTTDRKENEETPEEKAERNCRRTYRYKIVFGLFFPYALQALDMTIVASALPFIAEDFDQIAQLNWIITAFNLPAASFLPLFAQCADIFGRHATLQSAIIIMAIGSGLCTGAPTSAFGVLLLGRALQGIGAAGVNICVRTILADRVELAEYSKNWTLFAVIGAAAFAIGPVAGGYLTQVNWRWCFGINLPVAALAVLLVVILLRKELLGPQPLPELERSEKGRKRLRNKSTKRGRMLLRLSTVDYGGQVLFLAGMGLVVLGLTWAGGTYPWASAAVVVPLVVGAVLTGAWMLYEYAMAPGKGMARVFPLQRPMMPWELLIQRDIGLLFYINFSIGVAMFAVMYFMDLYFAQVLGHSSSDAGLALLYYLPGLGVGFFSATFFSNVFPRQTQPTLVISTITASTGITVLACATNQENLPLVYGMMALTGFGTGLSFNPGSLHALALFPNLTAPIQCLVSFSNPFGGTVGLTIMSTVFNNKSGANNSDPKTGIMWAFIAIMPIMWLSVVATTFLGNVWIKPGEGKDKGEGYDVVKGIWLWSVLFRRKLEIQHMVKQDPRAVAAESGSGSGSGSGGVLGEPSERREEV